MISDGCGYGTLESTDLWLHGRLRSEPYESFPVALSMRTASADGIVTDSAAAATAMATGFKTNNGYVGVDPDGNRLPNVLEEAEAADKATGVVTTVQWTDATPAGFLAHAQDRQDQEEIGRQIVDESGADVVMGAGDPERGESGQVVSRPDYSHVGGKGVWDSLVSHAAGGDANGDGRPDPWTLVRTRAQFTKLMQGRTPKRVLGTFENGSSTELGRPGDPNAKPFAVPFDPSTPTLSEMTNGALNLLDRDRDGFVLVIEGGAVDDAAHAKRPGRLIEEEADFDDAVRTVTAWVERHSSWDRTLLVVTADHETGGVVAPSGPGELPRFTADGHTDAAVPFFAKGVGSDLFSAEATGTDPGRGKVLDNTAVGRVLMRLAR